MTSQAADGVDCLQVVGVSHHYGEAPALRDVSLGARQSEVLALLGPSGSGKSTLLAAIAGMVRPNTGKILLRGRDLLALSPEARGLGMVFQDYALWPHMTVVQNVAFPLRARRVAPSEVTERTQNALQRVGLVGLEARRPHELSGGQQQRVALARAVVAEPQLLLLDEPLSALDPATRASVRGELAALLRKLALTTIIVTHEREEAFEIADRVAVLVDGQIQQHATPQEIYERPANLAVASFMGVNLLSVRVNGSRRAHLRGDASSQIEMPDAAESGSAELAIVPERTRIVNHAAGLKNVFPADLLFSQYRGGEYRLKIRVGNPEVGQAIEARSQQQPNGERLFVHLPAEALHIVRFEPLKEAPIPPITKSSRPSFQEEIA